MKNYKLFLMFLSKRIELMLFLIAIGILFLSQAISLTLDKDYSSFGVSWIENLAYDHVKAFNVLVGVWIILRLVFRGAYEFLAETIEHLIGGTPINGAQKGETLTIWQRSLLSFLLFFSLILVYALT